MTGKAYYMTTLGAWQRHAHRFAHSHWLALAPPPASEFVIPPALMQEGNPAPTISVGDGGEGSAVSPSSKASDMPEQVPRSRPETGRPRNDIANDTATRILVLIEADGGVHLSLEDDPAFEPLPHRLAQKPISGAAQSGLAAHGVPPGATTFDARETLARTHKVIDAPIDCRE